MAVYKNLRQDSPLAAAEFTPVSDGNFSFFTLNGLEQKTAFTQWLTSKEIGQRIIAETQIDGKPVLVTHGDKTKKELTQAIEARGDKLKFQPPPRKKIDTWKLIAMLAIPGQAMQMASSLMRGRKDLGLFVFAASNLLGHAIGWVYGSQKSDDIHRLRYMKKQVDDRLSDDVPAGGKLPGIHEDRSSFRDEPKAPSTTLEKANSFLKKNSVSFGELFLRYFGGFALAFPIDRWKAGLGKLRQGTPIQAFKVAKNPATLILATGLSSLLGKSIAFFSKAPDPYNPQPKSWLDTFREKYTFRLGGWVEAGAFGTMAYHSFKHQKIKFRGREYTDYLGGIGASMFTIRYMVRHWAKYGEKKVDMDEMYAHTTDSLAKISPEKLPQLIADTAADLTNHFKDKKLEFGQVYTQLMSDLYRYHHIALDNLGTEPMERIAKMNGTADLAQNAATNTLQPSSPRKPLDRVTLPAASHAEEAARAIPSAERGLV